MLSAVGSGFFRRSVADLVPYEPGRPVEEVQRELGLARVIKLASNEGPFGPFPAALEALTRTAGELNRYPDAGGVRLREALGARFGLPYIEPMTFLAVRMVFVVFIMTAIALLACSRNGYVCCPSLHRGHTVGEVVALVDRMRAAALIAEPGYGADADQHDIFVALADRDFLRERSRRLGCLSGRLGSAPLNTRGRLDRGVR